MVSWNQRVTQRYSNSNELIYHVWSPIPLCWFWKETQLENSSHRVQTLRLPICLVKIRELLRDIFFQPRYSSIPHSITPLNVAFPQKTQLQTSSHQVLPQKLQPKPMLRWNKGLPRDNHFRPISIPHLNTSISVEFAHLLICSQTQLQTSTHQVRPLRLRPHPFASKNERITTGYIISTQSVSHIRSPFSLFHFYSKHNCKPPVRVLSPKRQPQQIRRSNQAYQEITISTKLVFHILCNTPPVAFSQKTPLQTFTYHILPKKHQLQPMIIWNRG